MNKFSALLLCGLLAACGGGVEETKKPTQAAAQETIKQQSHEEKTDFKPINYVDPKAEAVCAKNSGLKGCYGFAFECNDGFKTKIDKVSCVNGQYVEDKPESVAQSTSVDSSDKSDSPQAFCKSLSIAAEATMKARQNGIPMSEAMELAGDNELIKAMVADAYNQNSYTSEKVKEQVIRDFTDRVYSTCWKRVNK